MLFSVRLGGESAGPLGALPTSCGKELGKAGKIVGGKRVDELLARPLQAAEHGLGEGTYGFAPAEGLLDPLADVRWLMP